MKIPETIIPESIIVIVDKCLFVKAMLYVITTAATPPTKAYIPTKLNEYTIAKDAPKAAPDEIPRM